MKFRTSKPKEKLIDDKVAEYIAALEEDITNLQGELYDANMELSVYKPVALKLLNLPPLVKKFYKIEETT